MPSTPSPTPEDSVTLATIAKQAGVSLTTVSNVLNLNRVGKRSDAKRNAARIREIADEMGYRPNMAARAMQQRKFDAIGLVSSTAPRFSIYRDYLPGLTSGCRDAGLQLSIGEVDDDKLADDNYLPSILREWSVDGLIIAYTYAYPPRMVELLESYRIPAVWLNAKRESDCVYPEDQRGVEQGVANLIEMGHQRVAYVNKYGGGHYSMHERWAGYLAAIRAADLQPDVLYPSPGSEASNRNLLTDARAMLAKPDRPTAVVAYSADQALTVYHAAVLEGLEVPRDLSIIGVSHAPISGLGRGFSTVRLPVETVARHAVELLQAKIAQPQRDHPPITVPFEQHNWPASVAPPPRG
jgi:LacI family transcriptional regulator